MGTVRPRLQAAAAACACHQETLPPFTHSRRSPASEGLKVEANWGQSRLKTASPRESAVDDGHCNGRQQDVEAELAAKEGKQGKKWLTGQGWRGTAAPLPLLQAVEMWGAQLPGEHRAEKAVQANSPPHPSLSKFIRHCQNCARFPPLPRPILPLRPSHEPATPLCAHPLSPPFGPPEAHVGVLRPQDAIPVAVPECHVLLRGKGRCGMWDSSIMLQAQRAGRV